MTYVAITPLSALARAERGTVGTSLPTRSSPSSHSGSQAAAKTITDEARSAPMMSSVHAPIAATLAPATWRCGMKRGPSQRGAGHGQSAGSE